MDGASFCQSSRVSLLTFTRVIATFVLHLWTRNFFETMNAPLWNYDTVLNRWSMQTRRFGLRYQTISDRSHAKVSSKKCFFCPSPLPFGGSTVLRGPAGNRTASGLSAPQEWCPTNFTTTSLCSPVTFTSKRCFFCWAGRLFKLSRGAILECKASV